MSVKNQTFSVSIADESASININPTVIGLKSGCEKDPLSNFVFNCV